MSESTYCPKCGIRLLADAPAGLCPKCLVQAGFDSQPLTSSGAGATVSRPASFGFEPPAVDELAGKFPQLEILALLGKGGMGAVYKARQRGLDRLVAVKILPPDIGHDAAFAERFTREARALARLTHNHIVSVYDFGQVDGLFFIVMEHVDGVNLRQTIQSGGLTPADALAIVPQICEALQFAHDEGIVHRDIKPENILIDKRGRVKIADFGLAKLLGPDASDHSLTATQQVMGTLRYMAPEQMQGSREVDHRADIYSLGVVFYELLTGELPMGKFAPPSKKVQVDVRLDEIVLRALEQEPEQRYQQASDVKTDVETISRTRQSLPAVPLRRPKLVPVLATFNLVGAIVLMLVCAMEEPAAFAQPVLPVWHVWGKVDSVLGFTMAAGMFAASIGLFLWKPWARKLTLGVCVFGLASFVFDAPYLARSAIPDVYAEIQHTVAEEGIEPDAREFVALVTVMLLIGGIMVVGLTWQIGQLVYFTRPRVVAAFESQRENHGKILDWLFTGAGAVVGVLSVFTPLALLLGIAALFKGDGARTIDSSAHPSGNRAQEQTGEVWFGDMGNEHVWFLGPNSPTVSDRLAGHLGLDPVQRAVMDQALGKFAAEFQSLEKQYTQTKIDENGHQITTIAPPPKQVAELVERFWTGLETDLDGRQLTIGRETVHLSLGMFAASDYGYRVEIWRVGQINPWYHWKELNSGLADFHADEIKPSSGPELPERLRRFWKETESAATKVE